MKPDSSESGRRYITPAWPDGEFNLLAEKGKFELGPFTADSWAEDDDGSLWWSHGVSHPVHLRVRMQTGDLIHANNGDVGAMTCRIVPLADPVRSEPPPSDPFDVVGKLSALLGFLDRAPLTLNIADLEHALDGSNREQIACIIDDHGVSPAVLEAGLLVRERLGRVNDVIHAVAIALCLPILLEPGEVMTRPSLAAGNDPSRPFDVETDRRIAEFKLSEWDGHDAMRKRQLVKDLVQLAADDSGRRPELYVLGDRPLRFLIETNSSIGWALDRFPAVQRTFASRFPDLSLEISIRAFRAGAAAHVRVEDVTETLGRLLARIHPH